MIGATGAQDKRGCVALGAGCGGFGTVETGSTCVSEAACRLGHRNGSPHWYATAHRSRQFLIVISARQTSLFETTRKLSLHRLQ